MSVECALKGPVSDRHSPNNTEVSFSTLLSCRLVKYVPLEEMQQRSVIVLCNLKPRNMRGIKSFGMLLAASDEAHENVEPLAPATGAAPGTRVWFGQQQEQVGRFALEIVVLRPRCSMLRCSVASCTAESLAGNHTRKHADKWLSSVALSDLQPGNTAVTD